MWTCGGGWAGGGVAVVAAADGRAIGGVCAGFAQAYGWDVILVRLALVAAVIFGCGAPILFYLVAWIVMPNEPFVYMAPTGTQTDATAAA